MVLTGALELENLDRNELEAVLSDIDHRPRPPCAHAARGRGRRVAITDGAVRTIAARRRLFRARVTVAPEERPRARSDPEEWRAITMGIFARLATLIKSNLNDLISRSEDPEKMLNQVILDMSSQLIEAKKQVAVSIADEKKLAKQAEQQAKTPPSGSAGPCSP